MATTLQRQSIPLRALSRVCWPTIRTSDRLSGSLRVATATSERGALPSLGQKKCPLTICVASVPSNNPHHEQAEVFSGRADDDKQVKPRPEAEPEKAFNSNLVGNHECDRMAADSIEYSWIEATSVASCSQRTRCIAVVVRFLPPQLLFECNHCRQRAKLVSFSEQYLLDCGKGESPDVDGCDSGLELAIDHPPTNLDPTRQSHHWANSEGHTEIDDLENLARFNWDSAQKRRGTCHINCLIVWLKIVNYRW